MESQYQPEQYAEGHPQRPGQHTRSKSSFSFKSQKSDKSTGSKNKLDLIETENEKRRTRFGEVTTANPNRAINEEQPAVRAQSELATLAPLRAIQHKDWSTGAVITDPDASNPSRSRMERPLDTIRSFNAAADGYPGRRSQPMRTESADAYASRRSSVILGYDNYHGAGNPRYAAPSGYDSRRSSYVRPNYDNPRGGPPTSYQRRGMGQRMVSAPMYGRPPPDQQPVPQYHGYNESHDTAYTGESSQSEPWGNSTDPSSENSSLDRIHAVKQSEATGDAYGGQYSSQGAPLQGYIAEEGSHGERGNYQGRGYQGQPYPNGAPSPGPAGGSMRNGQQPLPAPPPMVRSGDQPNRPFAQGQRRPSNQPQQQQQQPYRQRPPPNTYDSHRGRLEKNLPKEPTEKRKSWLKRTFSKNK